MRRTVKSVIGRGEDATISIENDGGGAEARSSADQVVVEAAERAQKDAWDLHRLAHQVGCGAITVWAAG